MKRQKKMEKSIWMLERFIVLFSQKGMDRATIRDLAELVDFSPAMLYQFFSGKEDIIGQCVRHYHEPIQQGVTRTLEEYAGQPDVLPHKLLEYIDGVIDISRFLLQVLAHPEYSYYTDETNRKVSEQVSKGAEALRSHYRIGNEMAQGLASLINSSINAYVLKKDKECFLLELRIIFRGMRER